MGSPPTFVPIARAVFNAAYGYLRAAIGRVKWRIPAWLLAALTCPVSHVTRIVQSRAEDPSKTKRREC
jgi:hypothetical protein